MLTNFMERLKNINEMEEMDIYLHIVSLNHLMNQDSNELFGLYLKRLVLELRKFNIFLEDGSFNDWYNYYKDYFDSLKREEFYLFIFLYNNNFDISSFKPVAYTKKMKH